ncbi:hypothetical protein D3C81_531400 [compost metagenome]
MKKTKSKDLIVSGSRDYLGLKCSFGSGERKSLTSCSGFNAPRNGLARDSHASGWSDCLIGDDGFLFLRTCSPSEDSDLYSLQWGKAPLSAEYILLFANSYRAKAADLARAELIALGAGVALSASASSKSEKTKNGKLQKKPRREISDAMTDLELHIQKNHELFESWFSLAKSMVIDDSGALAGNKRKRHAS